MVENIYYQAAEKTSSPIPSSQKSLINTTLTEYPFSMDSARHILQEENWKDSNGDGILDKVVDGNQTDFSITYVYNTNDEFRKSFGILLQNRAKSVGIDIRIDGVDWSNYLQRLRSGDFDLLYGSKGNPPIPPDLFANFHSSNANGGRNYTNYKSLKSDSLMEAIRLSNSDAERKELYMHLQAEIHQDLPVLFLVEPHETFVYSNQLEQVHISPIRPNYWAPSIKIKE